MNNEHYRKSFDKIKALTKPNYLLYWGDLLGTALCCYGLTYAWMSYSISDPMKWVYFIACVFFVNRGIYFMHEVLHQGRQIKGFDLAQNLFFGFIFKFPSYTHTPHHHHHRATTYGTEADPEYDDAWIGKGPWHYLSILPVSLIVPVILFIRFGILPFFYPIMGQKLRLKIYQHASTFAMNSKYVRPLPTQSETISWLFQDGATCIINLTALTLVFTQRLSLENYLLFNLLISAFFICNFYRALVAHKYNASHDKTIEAQVRDSISIPNSISDFFWAPVGLKYHGLHHYFPTIPYHNLKKAHQILMNEGDEVYRLCLEDSFPTALVKAMKGSNLQTSEEIEQEENIAA